MDGPATAQGQAAGTQGLAAGTRFGRYAVVRPMAGGGMSEVYLGVDAESGASTTPVAIKRLLPHMAWDPEYVRMFLDEVRIAAGLDHPNIVQVHDYGMGDGGYYLAMEYVHGQTLHATLRAAARANAIPLRVAVLIVLEVAEGLAYAHTRGLVHRDVSPSNVIVAYDGRVKFVDFGIARIQTETRHTRAGTLKGKIGYMSPEQCQGKNVDARADVFALGILLYELTVGRRAFFGDNDYAVINRVVSGDYRPPTQVREAYPEALEAIVERALSIAPEDRFPHARAFADALRAEAFGEDRPSTQAFVASLFGSPPLPSLELPATETPRSRGGLRAAAIVLATLGIAGGGYALGVSSTDIPTAETAPRRPEPATPAAAANVEPSRVPPAPVPAATRPRAATPATPPTPAAEPPVAEAGAAPTESAPASTEPSAPERKSKQKRKRRRRKARRDAGDRGTSKPGNALLPPSWKKE